MRLPTLMLPVLLMASACGGDDPAIQGGPTGDPPGTTAGCVDATGDGAAATLVMRDNAFEPSCLILSTEQNIRLQNDGAALHNFNVENQDIDLDVPAGQSATTEAIGQVVEAGTYRFGCAYHPVMVGELRVQ